MLFGLIAIEHIMIFGIGFLAAVLCSLAFVAAVHNRAVRLTRDKFEATLPASMKEMRAQKDLMRADFAVAASKLQTNLGDLRDKAAAHVAELAKKSALIDRLKASVEEKSNTIAALELREKTLELRDTELFDELQAAKKEIARRTDALIEAERAAAASRTEASNLAAVADARTRELQAARSESSATTSALAQTEHSVQALRSELLSQAAAAEARERDLWNQLSAARNDGSVKTGALAEAERSIASMRSELSDATRAAEERRQQNEIVSAYRPAPTPLRRPTPIPQPQPAPVPAMARDWGIYEPRTTAEWLELGKRKLRSSEGEPTHIS